MGLPSLPHLLDKVLPDQVLAQGTMPKGPSTFRLATTPNRAPTGVGIVD